MIQPSSTLFAKILSWFFLNLLLVMLVLTLFFAFQPQVHLHEFFGQQGSDRLQATGMLIAHDLNQAQPEEWAEILARHGTINGVDFVLVLRNGAVFPPTLKTLPKEVMLRSQNALRHKGSRARMRRPPLFPEKITRSTKSAEQRLWTIAPKAFFALKGMAGDRI